MDTKTYLVREGVDWIDGARVPDTRKVSLTSAQALFDLAHGRITLDDARESKKADVPSDDD